MPSIVGQTKLARYQFACGPKNWIVDRAPKKVTGLQIVETLAGLEVADAPKAAEAILDLCFVTSVGGDYTPKSLAVYIRKQKVSKFPLAGR